MSNQTFPSSTDHEIDEFHGSALSEGIPSIREALLPIYMFHQFHHQNHWDQIRKYIKI